MNAKKLTLLLSFIFLFLFSIVSRIFFNDFQDGWVAYVKKDYKTAHELWLPLAEKGNSKAQFFLGFMHDFGFGTPEDNHKAVKWYRLAAEQGDSRAQLFMGLMYADGLGIPRDYQEAIKWYQLVAEQGHSKAKTNIYVLAKKNVPEALKILMSDAENGGAEAQYTLGLMYADGQGVPRDYVLAHMWYNLSGLQRYERAPKRINLVEKKMSSQQIEKAREMARDWKPKKQTL